MSRASQIFTFLLIHYCAVISAQNGDCFSAFEITVNEEYETWNKDPNVTGFGERLEFSGYELGNSNYFTEEHNTAWYVIKVESSGKLCFTITPNNTDDDWDFLLFDAGTTTCDDIVSGNIKPLRTNLARNDPGNSSLTGLSLESNKEKVPAGPNDNFSKYLDVEEGDQFLLVIDNNKHPGRGYSIQFKLKPAESKNEVAVVPQKERIKSNIIKEIEWVNESDLPKSVYNIRLSDSKTSKSISGDLKVIIEIGFGNDSIIEFNNVSQVEVAVETNKNFSVSATKEGYMFSSSNYRSKKSDTTINIDLSLPKAEVGQIVSLPDINFKENTTHLLTNSIHALNEIYDFLEKYPNTKIEIRGHVNAPGHENTGKVKRFSEKRADEIKEFLIGMGVDSGRMKTLGLGNSEMIYPSPSNYEQEKANRRVEIKILEK